MCDSTIATSAVPAYFKFVRTDAQRRNGKRPLTSCNNWRPAVAPACPARLAVPAEGPFRPSWNIFHPGPRPASSGAALTLGGPALAVGILVDDATVTIENVNWHLEQAKGVRGAILDGAKHRLAAEYRTDCSPALTADASTSTH